MRKHLGSSAVIAHSDGWSTRYSYASEDRDYTDWVSARWMRVTQDRFVMELTYRPGYWVALNWARHTRELHGPFMDLHVAKTTLLLLGDGS